MSDPAPKIEMAPAPCSCCGARDEAEAETMCRPSSDQDGEFFCDGMFEGGISVRETPESLRALNEWCDRHAALDAEYGPPSAA